MELLQSKEQLKKVNASVDAKSWDKNLAMALQRALAEIYLLNPHDDVDGLVGPRTRAAWQFFLEARGQKASNAIDGTSAKLLIDAIDHPGRLIGEAKVALQCDFEFKRRKSQANRAASVPSLIQAAREQNLSDAQIAYILATAEHESDSFNTLEEYSSGDQYDRRSSLGNTQPGDGRRYKGRGYVQLTGRLNYTRYSEITGLQLTQFPTLLMNRPALSVFVIVDGMMRGVYTGRRLDEFVNTGKQDFFQARKVVNGLDRADKIAAQAQDWLRSL